MYEIWKDIKGFEGLYQVSNAGRVKSLARRITFKDSRHRDVKDHIMKLVPDKDGYLSVGLAKDNKRRTVKVHRLVANEFISNPQNKPVVNHLNERKNDNRANNLEWATVKENTDYGNGMRRLSKAMSTPVFVSDVATGFKKIYSSMLSASKELHGNPGNFAYALHTGGLAMKRYQVEAI